MNTPYITSITSLKCKTSFSFTVSDYYIHDKKNPIPPSLQSCCSCCVNSLNKLKIPINPSFLYGFKQSTLIQCTPNRRLAPRVCSRFTVCDIDPNRYYRESVYSLKDRRGSGRKWRKGNYGFRVLEERGKGFYSCKLNDVDAELMISLLSEEVSEEFSGVRERNVGKMGKKKIFGSGYKCDYRAVECQSKEEEGGRRRERVNEDLRERKEGSRCSSYYSLSSLGEIDGDSEVQIKDDGFVEELTEKGNGGIKYEEEIVRGGDCNENEGIRLEKKDTMNRVESDWRKKTEKKLTEVSVDQANFKKESSQKLFSSSDMNEKYDGKKRGIRSSSGLCIDEGRSERVAEVGDDVTRQLESKIKYNQVREREQIQSSVDKVSLSSEKQCRGRDDYKSGQYSTRSNEIQEKIQQRAKVSEIKKTDTTTNAEERELTLKTNLRKESQQSTEISGTSDVDIDSTIISQRRSNMRIKKMEEASSSYQEVKEQQSQTDVNAIKRLESRKEAHDFIADAENITKSNYEVGASSEEKGQMSSPNLQLEIHGESRRREETIASADKLQPFGTHFVSEFVEKAKKESSISTSELKKVTLVTKKVDDENKQTGQPGSGDYQPKDRDSSHSGRSSRNSGAKGPSDEMWAVNNPTLTTEEPPEIEASEGGTNEVVKRSGKSIWDMMSDIVRLRWGPRSETHSLRSAERTSPNQSTTSEARFSSNEHDAYVSDTVKKETIGDPQSVDQQQETSQSQSQRETSGESSAEHLVGNSGTELSKPIPLPAISDASGSGTTVDSEIISGTENKDEEVKRRKPQRNKQVAKDRFDEWEEAFTVEMEQRKTDEMFMNEALLEATKAGDMWEVPVGAVLVQHGKIIARGYNLVEELRDSTAHAEMICIREGSNVLQSWRLSDTTLYITLEPCPMCAGAILQARVDTVVWGAPNKLLGADGSWIRLFPNGGEEGNSLKPRDNASAPIHPFHPKMKVRRGVLEPECANVMREFFQLRRKKKEKKTEPITPPPPCLPISHHSSKFFTKMHHIFNVMFCL